MKLLVDNQPYGNTWTDEEKEAEVERLKLEQGVQGSGRAGAYHAKQENLKQVWKKVRMMKVQSRTHGSTG
ncbi:MAG: hypothetical protein ACLTER_20770 [Ruminococcus sp.]